MAKIKNKNKPKSGYIVKRKKTHEEIEKEEVKSSETTLYWIKILYSITVAFVGRVVFGLVGWWMFLWLLLFWFPFSFIPAYFVFRELFDKDILEWFKISLKTGVGGFFFVFMVVSTVCHTLLVAPNWTF